MNNRKADDRLHAFAVQHGLVPQPEWRKIFHSAADFDNAPPLSFAIHRVIQNDAATLVGGLAGDGKTFFMMSVAGALLAGPTSKLWNYFDVLETADRVVYLIPESTIGPFAHRLRLLGLMDAVKDDRLLVRTLSMGMTPELSDPRILESAKGAYVFLDSAIRFADGDENSAGDNQRGLAADIFALLGAGARAVIGAHHAPKSFGSQTSITLENVLRGSGDLGAMVGTAFGIKQIDAKTNTIHIECVKSRDFEPTQPFHLIGRPYIDQTGDFYMSKKPGECGHLEDEQAPATQGGASKHARESKAANIALLNVWEAQDPSQTSEALSARFKNAGINVTPGTVRRYRTELTK